MAKIIIVAYSILLLILICGCMTEKERQEEAYDQAASRLNKHFEKIVLLSSLEKVPYDTLFLILRDYDAEIKKYNSNDDSLPLVCKRTISTVSKKYHVPESRIASLLFSFKYEMQTKEEIIEEEEEKQEYINSND